MDYRRQNLFKCSWLLQVSVITMVIFAILGNNAFAKSTTRQIDTDKTVGLENSNLSIVFNKTTGSLVGIKNNAVDDEYVKNAAGGLFRAYINVKPVTQKPQGGTMITAADCVLMYSSFEETKDGQSLTMTLKHGDSGFEFTIVVELADNSLFADCGMTVTNYGQKKNVLMVDFPYIAGLCLGDNAETNLGLYLAGSGITGEKAWEDKARLYGNGFSMQWNAVYDKASKLSLGTIILDKEFGNK